MPLAGRPLAGEHVAFGDGDGDGDLDLYLANSGDLFQTLFDDELWINQP